MTRSQRNDVRILGDSPVFQRLVGDEWIILRVNDERGRSDAFFKREGAGARGVVISVAISSLLSGESFLELSHGGDAAKARRGVIVRGKPPRPGACALVQPHDVEASAKCFQRGSNHVNRLA